MITTTLSKILAHAPCGQKSGSGKGWDKLLTYLGKTESDDEPLPILTILESNGLEDALWALRAADGYDREIRLLACQYACRVLPMFEKKYPKDHRPRQAIESAALLAEIENKILKAHAAYADYDTTRAAAYTAYDTAYDAAYVAAYAAAYEAARAACANYDAARAAAYTAYAAAYTAYNAAYVAAYAARAARAARAAAYDDEKKHQEQELRKMLEQGHDYMRIDVKETNRSLAMTGDIADLPSNLTYIYINGFSIISKEQAYMALTR